MSSQPDVSKGKVCYQCKRFVKHDFNLHDLRKESRSYLVDEVVLDALCQPINHHNSLARLCCFHCTFLSCAQYYAVFLICLIELDLESAEIKPIGNLRLKDFGQADGR